MNQTKRLIHIDIIAGIMIFWMILGHCSYFSHYGGIPLYSLLSFYMPWFFYKSGMLFHPNNQVELYKKDISKYLRYFVVYSFIGWLIWTVCGIVDGSLTIYSCMTKPIKGFILHGNIPGNGALWFLLSLFLVRQIGNFILNKSNYPPLASFLCFATAFLLYAVGWYNFSWWFGNLFSGLCFFLLGYWLKDKEQKKILFLISTVIYLLVVFASFADAIEGFPYLYMHANKMYSGSYLLFYPMALAGIIMTNNVFRILSKHVKFQILGYIGRNSMNFYVTHWILFVVVTFIAKTVFRIDSPSLLFILLLSSSVVFLPLISKSIDTLKSHNNKLNKIL